MNRDRDLFWDLLEPEHLKARAYCRKLMGNRDDGDDLYQDSLVRALTRFGGLREIGSFRVWLYKIIVSTFKNRIRQPWWRRLVSLSTQVVTLRSEADSQRSLSTKRRLDVALAALTPAEKTLVVLRELQGWPIAQLAAIYGKSEGSIRVRVSRARSKMRQALVRDFRQAEAGAEKPLSEKENVVCAARKFAQEYRRH